MFFFIALQLQMHQFKIKLTNGNQFILTKYRHSELSFGDSIIFKQKIWIFRFNINLTKLDYRINFNTQILLYRCKFWERVETYNYLNISYQPGISNKTKIKLYPVPIYLEVITKINIKEINCNLNLVYKHLIFQSIYLTTRVSLYRNFKSFKIGSSFKYKSVRIVVSYNKNFIFKLFFKINVLGD